MTNAAIYVRISADKEGRSLGVERQEQQCRDLAARLGYTVVTVYSENDVSASRWSRKIRPQYRDMLTAARSGEFSVIIAATSSRLTRRPRELEDLLDLFDAAGTLFEFAKSPRHDLKTAAGRKFARYAAADDAAESDEISERVTDKLNQRKAAGLPHGGQRPFGWEMDRVTIREAEAQWIRWGARQILAGVPIRAQLRELDARGVTNTHGGEWRHATWRGILTTARHAGLMRDGSPGAWPEIISPQEYRAVLRVLNDPARVTTPGRAGKLHLLSGLAKCGVCDGPVRVGKTRSRGSSTYPVYVCPSGAHVTRHQVYVDEFVLEVLAEHLRRKGSVLLLGQAGADERAARVAAENEAERLRRDIDQAAEDHAKSGLPFSTLAAYVAPLRELLAAAEQKATAPRSRSAVLDGVADADDPGAAFLALPVDRQRAVIDLLVTVRIGKGLRGNTFRPDGIEITWR